MSAVFLAKILDEEIHLIYNFLCPPVLQRLAPDWRSEGSRSSSSGTVKNFLFSKSSRQVLRLTQPPSQWIVWVLTPGVMRTERDADLHLVPRSRIRGSTYHFPIRLHGVVLNLLNTGTTLQFTWYFLSVRFREVLLNTVLKSFGLLTFLEKLMLSAVFKWRNNCGRLRFVRIGILTYK
jgi:hypothetical protein